MTANALMIPFIYLHPGDLTLSELMLVLLMMPAALALPFVLIGIFVWFVIRPKERVSSIRNIEADRG